MKLLKMPALYSMQSGVHQFVVSFKEYIQFTSLLILERELPFPHFYTWWLLKRKLKNKRRKGTRENYPNILNLLPWIRLLSPSVLGRHQLLFITIKCFSQFSKEVLCSYPYNRQCLCQNICEMRKIFDMKTKF